MTKAEQILAQAQKLHLFNPVAKADVTMDDVRTYIEMLAAASDEEPSIEDFVAYLLLEDDLGPH